MGWYDEDALAQIMLEDLKDGHEWDCKILENISEGGGYCNCGKFVRGVSPYDPINQISKLTRKERFMEWLKS
jgi:hypothetical protein